MFPLCNFVYFKVCFMLKFVFSMSNVTTDDCGQVPYELIGCLVESYPGLTIFKNSFSNLGRLKQTHS